MLTTQQPTEGTTAATRGSAGKAAVTLNRSLGALTLMVAVASALSVTSRPLDTWPTTDPAPAGLAMTLAAEHALDLELCQRTHGPRATRVELPDGQHRCTVAAPCGSPGLARCQP